MMQFIYKLVAFFVYKEFTDLRKEKRGGNISRESDGGGGEEKYR